MESLSAFLKKYADKQNLDPQEEQALQKFEKALVEYELELFLKRAGFK